MDNMIDCGTALLLSPGVAQVFYGDETGRKLTEVRLNVDGDQAFRFVLPKNGLLCLPFHQNIVILQLI